MFVDCCLLICGGASDAQEAASGVPGPVFVEFPIDVLYNIGEIRANMGLGARKRAKVLQIVSRVTTAFRYVVQAFKLLCCSRLRVCFRR